MLLNKPLHNNTNIIYLVGYMAVGKTTIGRQLAAKLNYQFIDLDEVIVFAASNASAKGETIASLFATKGEAHFRQLEEEHLHIISQHKNVVIATGGGTACSYNNMAYMLQQGVVVWIQLPVPQIVSRILNNDATTRPLTSKYTTAQTLTTYVQAHLTERNKYYAQAHVTVNGTHDLEKIMAAIQTI